MRCGCRLRPRESGPLGRPSTPRGRRALRAPDLLPVIARNALSCCDPCEGDLFVATCIPAPCFEQLTKPKGPFAIILSLLLQAM
jgi:hypothetical protein